MPEQFRYIQGEIRKLNKEADHFCLKIDSRHYEKANVSGETHWMSFTPDEMLLIRRTLNEIENARLEAGC